MKPTTYRISLDVHDTAAQLLFTAKKGDTARRLIITLTEGSESYGLDDGCYAILGVAAPDGDFVFDDCTVKGNTIIYDMTANVTSEAGRHACELMIFGPDGQQLTTPRFDIMVYTAIGTDEETESGDEYKTLAALAHRAAEIEKSVAEFDSGLARLAAALSDVEDFKENKHKALTLTLSAAEWSGRRLTAAINGIRAKSPVIIVPSPTSMDRWVNANIRCIDQTEWSPDAHDGYNLIMGSVGMPINNAVITPVQTVSSAGWWAKKDASCAAELTLMSESGIDFIRISELDTAQRGVYFNTGIILEPGMYTFAAELRVSEVEGDANYSAYQWHDSDKSYQEMRCNLQNPNNIHNPQYAAWNSVDKDTVTDTDGTVVGNIQKITRSWTTYTDRILIEDEPVLAVFKIGGGTGGDKDSHGFDIANPRLYRHIYEGTLTFECSLTPGEDISANVLLFGGETDDI